VGLATTRRAPEAIVVRTQTWRKLQSMIPLGTCALISACATPADPNSDMGTTAGGSTAPDGGTVTTGGTKGTGGTARTAGATGIGGGPSTGGTKGTGGNAFWIGPYDANCVPAAVGDRDQSNGHHKPGSDCMTSGCHLNPTPAHHSAGMDCTQCHLDGSPDGSGAPEFLYGGTVYQGGASNGAAKVQVGVKSGNTLTVACSASNGNFWILAGPSIAWSSATARIRNGAGDSQMPNPTGAGCNASGCHDAASNLRLSAP
jgi:hypothetical protein